MIFKKNIPILICLLAAFSHCFYAPPKQSTRKNPVITSKQEAIYARQQEIQTNWNRFSNEEKESITLLVNFFNYMLKSKQNPIKKKLIEKTKQALIDIENETIINAETIDGRTFLMLAATIGNIELCELLLKKNIDSNTLDIKGMSALMYAIDGNAKDTRAQIIQMLLKLGADPLIKNNSDFSALEIAKKNKQEHIVQIIREDLAKKLEHKNKTKILHRFYELLQRYSKDKTQLPSPIYPNWNDNWTVKNEESLLKNHQSNKKNFDQIK